MNYRVFKNGRTQFSVVPGFRPLQSMQSRKNRFNGFSTMAGRGSSRDRFEPGRTSNLFARFQQQRFDVPF